MSVRFRRSVKIAPGVRVNLSKRSAGVSVGGPGAHYSVNTSGRRTTSVGVPGTGLSYQKIATGGQPRSASAGGASKSPPAPAAATIVQALPKPGWLASGVEKAYYAGVIAYLSQDLAQTVARFEEVTAQDASIGSAHLFAGVAAEGQGDHARAAGHLEAIVSGGAPLPDRFMVKYLPEDRFDLRIAVKVTDLIQARPTPDAFGAALMLMEVYQASDRLEEAIGFMVQLHDATPDRLVQLSLCDLLLADGDFEGVLEVAGGVTNDDDVAVEILHILAVAQTGLGHVDGALATLRTALAKTANRDPNLLLWVRYDRALIYEQAGQHEKARADLERVYAGDRGVADVAERLGRPANT